MLNRVVSVLMDNEAVMRSFVAYVRESLCDIVRR